MSLDELHNLVKGKNVLLCTHWDADGVTSGALVFHLVKDHAKNVQTITKGLVFVVEPKDVKGTPDVIICVDIHASLDLLKLDKKPSLVYIDHHPCENTDEYDLAIHDDTCQSCSLLIWRELIPETQNPFFLFLTLLGYFGDGGDRENVPNELFFNAQKHLQIQTRMGVHNLMEKKKSMYGSGYYYEIEKYVSALNTGKRMHWSGDIPFELMKNINDIKPFIYNLHPIAEQLQCYRRELRNLYSMDVKLHDSKHVQYGMIECDKNVQGVLCARHMKDKPIMIMNKHKGSIIASMRVPDDVDFDAGSFLHEFSTKIDSCVGGGHEKAAGVTFDTGDLDKFLDLIKEG